MTARRIPVSVAEHLKHFAQHHAPDVAVGVIDGEGLRSFAGGGLEGLDSKPFRRTVHHIASPPRLPDLFSDLNQWMLKTLIGRRLPESLISVSREQIRTASQLAAASRVSLMSASRLLTHLRSEGFLDDRAECIEIVRIDELLDQWVSANRRMARDISARWILKKDEKQFFASVGRYAADLKARAALKRTARNSRIEKAQPRCCIGLFAAADALGVGFVRGVPPHLYLEHLDSDVLRSLGLSVEDSDGRTDVYVRVPINKEAVFRADVTREGLPIADAVQVWLDVSAHPARGREQANEIRRRLLKRLFEKHG